MNMLLCLSDVLDFSKVKFTPGESIRVRTDQDKEECRITDICLVSDDRIVVADCANQSVKLLEVTTGRVLHQLQLQDTPGAVCQMSGDRVAVTEAGRIQVSLVTLNINT